MIYLFRVAGRSRRGANLEEEKERTKAVVEKASGEEGESEGKVDFASNLDSNHQVWKL